MREVLEALEWVRRELMHRGSPDFIRQRLIEGRVHQMASRLARSSGDSPAVDVPRPATNRKQARRRLPAS